MFIKKIGARELAHVASLHRPPRMDLSRAAREWKDTQKNLRSDGLWSWMKNFSTLEVQTIYCVQLNWEVGLLHIDKQRGRVCGIQLDQV